MKRLFRPAANRFDRRVDWRVDQVTTPRFDQRDEKLASLEGGLEKIYADLLDATTDVKRWVADDLDAGTEMANLVGQSLVRLSDSVDRLAAEVAALAERVARLESPRE